MTLVRRRPRVVYRVYSEEEYLAGVDALAEWATPQAGETRRGRRLQRVAGAAALTGAVGAVGGLVGLAVLRARPADRRALVAAGRQEAVAQLAASPWAARSRRAARSRMGATSRPSGTFSRDASPSRVSRGRNVADWARPRPTGGRGRRPVEVAPLTATAQAPAIPTRPALQTGARETAVNVAASAAGSAPVPASEARRPVQSEFGFER